MSLTTTLVCCALLAAPVRLVAAELTLPDAIREALAANPALRAAHAQRDAIAGQARAAGLWPNPVLEFSAEDLPVDAGGLGASKTMVGVAQTVPFPGKNHLDRQIARQERVTGEWEYRLKQRDLAREVKTAFYETLAAEKKANVAAELVTLAESLSEAARQQVAAGAAATAQQLRAEIELERARTDATAAHRDLTVARRKLAYWLGRNDLPAIRGELPETVPAPARPASHPQLAASTAYREQTDLALRRARLEPWPDLTVGVAAGRDRAADTDLLELRLSLPLPVFDRAQGQRLQARALAEAARHDVAATAQLLAQQWDITLARLQTAQAQVNAYRGRILPKAEDALQRVRQGYEAGRFGLADLVDTQRTSVEARFAFYDKLLELNSAAADLESLAGTEEPRP